MQKIGATPSAFLNVKELQNSPIIQTQNVGPGIPGQESSTIADSAIPIAVND